MAIINFANKQEKRLIIEKKKIGINYLSGEKKIGEKHWSGKNFVREKFSHLQKIQPLFPDFFSPDKVCIKQCLGFYYRGLSYTSFALKDSTKLMYPNLFISPFGHRLLSPHSLHALPSYLTSPLLLIFGDLIFHFNEGGGEGTVSNSIFDTPKTKATIPR